MSVRRPVLPTTFTPEQLLASKPKPSRRNSLESARRRLSGLCSQCREHALSQQVVSFEQELRRTELVAEKLRFENTKLLQQLQTRNSHRSTVQETLSELREVNDSLKLELQNNIRFRKDLGQQLLSVRQEKDTILQENHRLRQQKELIAQEKEVVDQEIERIRKQNVSLAKRLSPLELEVHTLREEKARLEHEKALMKPESLEQLQTLTEENRVLQKKVEQLEWDADQHQIFSQKFATVEQNAKELAQKVEQLEQDLNRETERLEETQKREHVLQSQLNKFKDSSHSCPRTRCMEIRADRDQLARKLEKKCGRPECVNAKAELEEAKSKIKQMEKKDCNSKLCKNEQLKDMNATIGSKVQIGDHEYSHSEALRILVQRTEIQHTNPSDEVKSLQSHLQNVQLEKQLLQEKLDAAVGSNAGRCMRSDCQRIHEQLRRMQSESIRQGRSAAKDMTIMSGGDYDKPLEEFNEVFTDPDELLGVLESCLEPFVAKKALCEIFQNAYNLCKEAALKRIRHTLECLFTVSEDRSRKDLLSEISRAYGLLLHVSGLKSDETVCRDISLKIVTALTEDEGYNKAGKALQAKQEYMLKCVEVAWKFVTLPSPIIASQPKDYNLQIVEREYGYWDESTPDAKLIYTRPVVYRCYDGNRAEKGMVANTDTFKVPAGQKKGYLQKAIDFVLQREQ